MTESDAAHGPCPTSGTDSGSEKDKGEAPANPPAKEPIREIGGQAGPEPTRFGDWERNGRCTDF